MQLLIAHKDSAARAALAKAIASGQDGDLDVIESGEGMEALELLLQEHAPRLAVVDWDMPGLDGPELCRLVRDYHLDGPPYIVLLAAGRHPDIEAGFEAGANDCIRTPARAAEIRDRVDAGWRFVQVPWERASHRGALAPTGPGRSASRRRRGHGSRRRGPACGCNRWPRPRSLPRCRHGGRRPAARCTEGRPGDSHAPGGTVRGRRARACPSRPRRGAAHAPEVAVPALPCPRRTRSRRGLRPGRWRSLSRARLAPRCLCGRCAAAWAVPRTHAGLLQGGVSGSVRSIGNGEAEPHRTDVHGGRRRSGAVNRPPGCRLTG